MKKPILNTLKHILILSMFLFISCTKQTQLRIIVTSDIHGLVFPYDFVNQREADGSLAQLETYLKQFESKDDYVLLDNGDFLQGQPSVYYSNFVDKKSWHITSFAMNRLGYDAASVGNHDIEAGPEVYNRLKEDFKFPWLAANIIEKQSGNPYFKPYTIIEKKGIKNAVLGLCTSSVPTWLPEKLWVGLEFADMYATAKKWVPIILEKEKPDLLIGLFHSGSGDADNNSSSPENASLYIAKNIPGFHIIITGHDHKTTVEEIENTEGDKVLVIGPGGHFEKVSHIALLFKGRGKQPEIVVAENISIKSSRSDPEFMRLSASKFKATTDFCIRPVGNLYKTISSRDAFWGSSAFVDLVHRAQLALSNAEISLAAPLGFDAQLYRGVIYFRDLLRLYRYENFLYVMNLSGKEIKDHLEYSYSLWIDSMGSENDYLLAFRKDKAGKPEVNEDNGKARLKNVYYNFDSAAGIEYEVDVRKPAGERVTIKRMSDGKAFSEKKIYRVAINSYRGSGGGGHLTDGAGIAHKDLASRIEWCSDKDLREMIFEWLYTLDAIPDQALNNWRMIPAPWVEKAKAKENPMLFEQQ